MYISKPVAAFLGLISAWPVIYFVLFFAFMFSTAIGSPAGRPDTLFEMLFVIHLATMLVMIGLLAFYIVHVFKNQALQGDRRVLWAIVLFMGNLFAFPVYWYLYVWHEPRQAAA
jgi:hypothetical protein